MAKKNEADFSAKDIIELKFPNGPRMRPSMYLGEQGSQQTVSLREIYDNSVTESLKGFANKIRVVFHKDNSYEVQDNGRGLPVDSDENGKNGFIKTLATLHAGSNFANSSTGKNGPGTNGVGGSVVNALSKRFSITVYKDGKQFTLDFRKGYPGHFNDKAKGYSTDNEFKPGDKISVTADKRKVSEKKEWKTGTIIRWTFDESCFPPGETVDIDNIVERLKYTVYIVPGLTINVVDETRANEDGTPYQWNFEGIGGLREMVDVIATDKVLPGTQQNKGDDFEKQGIFDIKTTGFYNDRTFDTSTGEATVVKREVPIELAFRYGEGFDTNVRSFVNTIQTHIGGVHEEAMEKAIVDVFGEKISSMKGSGIGKNDEKPIGSDYYEGLTAVISINVLDPQFVGQQKDKLSGPAVKKAITTALTKELEKFVNIPANRSYIESMFKKAIEAMKTRESAAEAKLVRQASKKLANSSSMPHKLKDCAFIGTDESELYICEGDSAASTITASRIAEFQAVLPIRGKILNVWRASARDILKNQEVQDIIKCLGAGSGDSFDVNNARYGKVIFAADADVDGLDINTLLTTLFFKMFRPMIEEGRVFQAVSPLFEIHVGSGQSGKILYAADDAEMVKITKKLQSENKKYKLQRAKGLGELDKEVFSDIVLDPRNRKVKRITIDNAEYAVEALELTRGNDADARKQWMSDNYQTAIDSGMVDL